jgi:hypothetical protein
MKVERVFTRLRVGLVACLVLASAAILVAAAGAANTGLPPGPIGFPAGAVGVDSGFQPNDTNIANLAWRGEELRFVKCDPLIPATGVVLPNAPDLGNLTTNTRANLYIEDWSGVQENSFEGPQAVSGTFEFFHSAHQGLNCVRGDYSSNKPGLAIIKLVVTTNNGVKILEHQFIAGWMSINSATMTNAGAVAPEIPGFQVANTAQVRVTGAIPLNAEFRADWGLPATLVMPNNWPDLARAMASTSAPLARFRQDIAPYQYWDIHDSSGPAGVSGDVGGNGNPDIHVPGICLGTSTTIDQVDNCLGPIMGGENGRSSRVFGDSGSNIGPFDRSYPGTLLSDGNLNAADAPMPPLRIDFINGGTFGFFTNSTGSDKHWVYSRDGLGSSTAHNLYAPYYSAYIPATSRNPGDDASGTDGPIGAVGTGQPNNFEGYRWYGQYHYWDIADVVVNDMGGPSLCRLRDRNEGSAFRPLNAGPQQAVVYTDEHGEARISWLPGVGNDAFGTSVGFVDINGGCDLEGVSLGSSPISATARYPFQNVALPTPVAGTVVKSLLNRFHKQVSCVRKNNVGSAIAYICTASALDITGSGDVFNGERVCFSREPENVWYDVGGNTPHQNGYCITLNGGTPANFTTGEPGSPAIGSVETPATLTGSQIDVQAAFVDEHLLRDTCITVGISPSAQGPCPAPGGGVGGTGGSTTGGSTTGGATTGGTTVGGGGSITSLAQPNVPRAKAKAAVTSVQLVSTRNGRVLMVRIVSPNKTAKIQVRLLNAKGKVITVVVRSVKTNKRVQVANLRIAKTVKTVRVRVLN